MNRSPLPHHSATLLLVILYSFATTVAEDNQLQIIDGIAADGAFPIGVSGTNNFLIVTNGGRLTLPGGMGIGYEQSAQHNGMLVTGADSQYYGPLTIGSYGDSNSLRILDGGSVYNNYVVLGAYETSAGNWAHIDGPHSLWTVDILNVGWSGSSNRVLVTNGARVNASAKIGDNAGSNGNLVEIIGPDSLWQGTVVVGFYGASNRLQVSNAGRLVDGDLVLSADTRSTGNALHVTGNGSELDLGVLRVGDSGSFNLVRIEDGASIRCADGHVGRHAIASGPPLSSFNSFAMRGSVFAVGNLTLAGDSNVLSCSGAMLNIGNLTIGGLGSFNHVVVQEGSTGSCVVAYVGANGSGFSTVSSSNTLMILGSDSIWTVGDLYLSGDFENGILVSNGSLVVTNQLFARSGPLEIDHGLCTVGMLSCQRASGARLVLKSGSLLVTQSANINYGTNVLSIGTHPGSTCSVSLLTGPHSLVASGGILLGEHAGSRGELLVAGPNSIVRGPLYVGKTELTSGSGAVLLGGGVVCEASRIVCGTNGVVSNLGGIFQFTAANPVVQSLSPNSIVLLDGTVSYRDVADVNPRHLLSSPTGLRTFGTNSFRLINSSTVPMDSYSIGTSGGQTYARLVLTNGTTRWVSSNLVIDAGGELFVAGTKPVLGMPGGVLVVTNGGKVRNLVHASDFDPTASKMTCRLSGQGTLWTNASEFALGYQGASNSCLIESGAKMFNSLGFIGYRQTSSNNAVTVRGAGSLWNSSSGLSVGHSGAGNVLTIDDDGEVRCSQMTIGANASSVSNAVVLFGGRLVVTNQFGDAALGVTRGLLTVMGGEVVADQLSASAGPSGQVLFRGGMVRVQRATVDIGTPFVVGDGVQMATLHLNGGTLSLAHGLVISSNATLSGYGTIVGNVTNLGTIIADEPGRRLVFTGVLRNSGHVTSVNGSGFVDITNVSRSGTSIEVLLNGIAGMSFALEYKESVLGAAWFVIPPVIPGTNGPMIFTDPSPAEGMRIYRVRAN